jgi:hypothetical protein
MESMISKKKCRHNLHSWTFFSTSSTILWQASPPQQVGKECLQRLFEDGSSEETLRHCVKPSLNEKTPGVLERSSPARPMGYGSLEEGQPAPAGSAISGRRKVAGLILAIACALAVASIVILQHGSDMGIELVVKPPHSEKKVVNAAEDATMDFANHDVTAAALKAEQEARANYAKMMASALKAEAKAHKDGQKATAISLKLEDKREHAKLEEQQQRAERWASYVGHVQISISVQRL